MKRNKQAAMTQTSGPFTRKSVDKKVTTTVTKVPTTQEYLTLDGIPPSGGIETQRTAELSQRSTGVHISGGLVAYH